LKLIKIQQNLESQINQGFSKKIIGNINETNDIILNNEEETEQLGYFPSIMTDLIKEENLYREISIQPMINLYNSTIFSHLLIKIPLIVKEKLIKPLREILQVEYILISFNCLNAIFRKKIWKIEEEKI